METDPDGAAGIEVTVVLCRFLAIKFLGAGTTLKMRYSCIDDQCGVRFGDFGDYVPCFDSMASFCVLRRLYEELDHDPAPIPTHDELFHREAQICEALRNGGYACCLRMTVICHISSASPAGKASAAGLPIPLASLSIRRPSSTWSPPKPVLLRGKPIVMAAACVLSALWVQRQDFAVAAARLGALSSVPSLRGGLAATPWRRRSSSWYK